MRVPCIALTLFLTCASWRACVAQSVASGVDAMNELFAGSVVMRMRDAETLLIDRQDANGRYRRDEIDLLSVDASAFAFSLEEDAIVLQCARGAGACITQEHFRLGAVRRSSQATLPAPAVDPGGASTIAWLVDITQAVQVRIAETQSRPERMKPR